MTKISKCIKKLRIEKNLTQEAVANQLFVTRQTVSSWESGRTEPDIETLCKLSELFGVEVEELIYGRLKVSAAEKEKRARQRLIVIFSSIASVLTAAGLVLIFVTCWNRMPPSLQTVFGFVPMLVGQTAAIVTYFKFRKSVAWREGASVLWGAGVVATIALTDSIHMIGTDFTDCLLIDILLVLPVIFILDAVTPLLFCYCGLIYFAINSIHAEASLNIFVAAPILFAACFGYVFINRKRLDDPGQIFAKWISSITFAVLAVIIIIEINCEYAAMWMLITTLFACMYFSSFVKEGISSAAVVGFLGTVAMTAASVFLYEPNMISYPDNGYESGEKIAMTASVAICILALTVTGILRRKKFAGDTSLIVFFICTGFLVLTQALFCVIPFKNAEEILYILTVSGAFAVSYSVVAYGVKKNNLFAVNAGLLSFSVILGYIIISAIGVNMFATGIMLIVFGTILFVINYFLARKIKRQKEGVDDA